MIVTLYKRGPVTLGRTLGFVRNSIAVAATLGGNELGSTFTGGFDTSSVVTPASCAVDSGSSNLTKTLPRIPKSTLDANRIGGKISFTIDLNCPSGADTSKTIFVTLTTDNKGTDTGVIAPTLGLAPDGRQYAANVGVQLLDKASTAITFGTRLSSGRVVNNGQVKIPISAQYFRTGAVAGTGPVKAIATFDIFYN
jgi:type 1 fimbria pilin